LPRSGNAQRSLTVSCCVRDMLSLLHSAGGKKGEEKLKKEEEGVESEEGRERGRKEKRKE